ncbi:hypothetical protein DOTSEDRAFT_36417 [Dothistroma septosporum NZE10]|uniref:Uncharacterized protein n=1 Tax=Dothistroma septosporum (strain NZE10 / CBS 128990) TaxID=675120 RepID=N1PJI4_DOTSN|nr:hypothetical protein DOTSEDRAFT_36417 [Dothistroma septosporum NZE10]
MSPRGRWRLKLTITQHRKTHEIEYAFPPDAQLKDQSVVDFFRARCKEHLAQCGERSQASMKRKRAGETGSQHGSGKRQKKTDSAYESNWDDDEDFPTKAKEATKEERPQNEHKAIDKQG